MRLGVFLGSCFRLQPGKFNHHPSNLLEDVMKEISRKMPMSKTPEDFLVPLEGLKPLQKPRCYKPIISTVSLIEL